MRRFTFSLAFALLLVGGTVSAVTSVGALANSGFDADLGGWHFDPAAVQWTNRDSLGSPESGSALIQTGATSEPGVISQCVNIPISPGLLPYGGPVDVGGRFFLPSGQGQRAFGEILVDWYPGLECSGASLHTDRFETPVPPPTDGWTVLAHYGIAQPGDGAGSALVSFGIGKLDSPNGPGVSGYVDATFFRLTSCLPYYDAFCLHGGRFRVSVEWESATAGGVGHGVLFNDDSAYFWFFSPNNTEVVVKTLDACADPFNHYWVFAAGLTNVFVTLTVEDTVAGVTKEYVNPGGAAFLPIQDTASFDTCP